MQAASMQAASMQAASMPAASMPGAPKQAALGGMSSGFLSTETASPREKRLAAIVVAVSLAAFIAALPFVRVQEARVPAFIPAYEAALFITDAITAVLLFGQFVRLRSPALLIVASGYVFDGMMVVPHALTFPGVFSAIGLLGAGTQTTAWLYMFWHFGFPLFVLAYALVKRPGERLSSRPATAIAAACAGVLLLVSALTLLATAGDALLPVIIEGDNYSRNVAVGVTPGLWLATGLVLLVLWRRSVPTVLDLWLMVVLVAWLLDIGLSAVFGLHRYDFGWYAGRMYGLLASSFVLASLLVEMNRLYGNLAEALELAERRNAELIRSREEFAKVQRLEAIGQLVSGVAHDFNNTLTIITSGMDLMLRDASLTERHRRFAEAAMQAARRGAQMTRQLLTFSRQQVLRPEAVNPNEVIASLASFIARAAGENVRVVHRLSPVLWPTRIDRTEFETALVNLAMNARDAMGGQGEVVIETRNAIVSAADCLELPAGDYALIAVSDSGPGMTPEVAARAFDPFFTTKEFGKGSGLGLSQVYGFAQGASGQVRVVSNPGEGARVEIYLPKSAGIPRRDEFGLGPVRAKPARGTVLVVEDDPAVLDIAVSGLIDSGYRVKTAANGQDALAILRSDPEIDVLFSDVIMPGGMNGAQLAAEAKRIRPGLKVLLTSGYTASALAKDHGLSERLDVLSKPYRRDDLTRTLQLVIGDGNPPIGAH